jgi:hypothetical protein
LKICWNCGQPFSGTGVCQECRIKMRLAEKQEHREEEEIFKEIGFNMFWFKLSPLMVLLGLIGL